MFWIWKVFGLVISVGL